MRSRWVLPGVSRDARLRPFPIDAISFNQALINVFNLEGPR